MVQNEKPYLEDASGQFRVIERINKKDFNGNYSKISYYKRAGTKQPALDSSERDQKLKQKWQYLIEIDPRSDREESLKKNCLIWCYQRDLLDNRFPETKHPKDDRVKKIYHIGNDQTTTLKKESFTTVLRSDEQRKRLKKSNKKIKRYTRTTPYSDDILENTRMKNITTIKISKSTRDLINDLKVIPEETCNHVVYRVLAEAKKVREKA